MLQGLEVPDPWAALPVEVVTAVSSSTLSLHPDEGPLSTKGTLGFYVYFSAGNKGKAASSLLKNLPLEQQPGIVTQDPLLLDGHILSPEDAMSIGSSKSKGRNLGISLVCGLSRTNCYRMPSETVTELSS
jgi:hypothetical protein